LHGGDRPDCAQHGGPLVSLRDDRRHRLGRRLHGRELARHGLKLPDLQKPETGNEHGHQDQHENHSLSHLFLSQLTNSSIDVPG
jgi:hypothetical protein